MKNKKILINFAEKRLIKNKNKQNILFRYSLLAMLIGFFLLPQIAYFSTITPENIIDITNQERINNNLKPLTANQLLAKAAYSKALAILESQTFQHNIDGKKFSTWIKDAGYRYSYTGENLAIDFATSEGVVKAWMESPTHKENLLNSNFSEIGVAVVEGEFHGQNSIIVVQAFGQPLATITALPKKAELDSAFSENQLTRSLSLHQPEIKNNQFGEEMLLTSLPLYNIPRDQYWQITFTNISESIQFLPIFSLISVAITLIYAYISYFIKIVKMNHQ